MMTMMMTTMMVVMMTTMTTMTMTMMMMTLGRRAGATTVNSLYNTGAGIWAKHRPIAQKERDASKYKQAGKQASNNKVWARSWQLHYLYKQAK